MTVRDDHPAPVDLAAELAKRHPRDLILAHCEACGGRTHRPKHWGNKVLPNRLYAGATDFPEGVRDRFPLVYQECLSCGCGRINPTPSRKFVDFVPRQRWWSRKHNRDGGARWIDSPDYVRDKQRSLRAHYEHLNLSRFREASDSVLDISCASGVGLELLRTEFSWQRCEGIECDPAAVRAARERGLQVSHGLIYNAQVHYAPYGLVMLDNALEHHWSPTEALQRIHRLLHPDGAAFIVVPNFHGHAVELFGVDYGNLNWGHWHYFTAQSLHILAARCGFHIDTIYSSMCEPIVVERLGHVPQHINVEMRGPDVANLPPLAPAFRGEFLHLTLVKAR